MIAHVDAMSTGTIRKVYRRIVPWSVRSRVGAVRQRARHLPARTNFRFRKSRTQLAALRDAFAGRACVIMGNGPSMRGFDLGRLCGVSCFCLNRGYLMWRDQNRTPDFLVAVNRLVIEQFGTELQAVRALKFVPWLLRTYFDETDENLVFFEERWDEAFVTDARDGLSSLATVTNTALQLAWHMGFSHVILIGIDHHFTASAKGRPHEAVVQAQDDIDHFRPDYFAPGTQWHLPDLEMSERGYRMARRTFEKAGRRIINATPGTRLDVFEKGELDDLLRALG